jgi:hypothetical protein
MKQSKGDLRKATIENAANSKDTGFRQLTIALTKPRVSVKGESIMAKAMKRAENLEIFRENLRR